MAQEILLTVGIFGVWFVCDIGALFLCVDGRFFVVCLGRSRWRFVVVSWGRWHELRV